jgi:hypothetical protein
VIVCDAQQDASDLRLARRQVGALKRFRSTSLLFLTMSLFLAVFFSLALEVETSWVGYLLQQLTAGGYVGFLVALFRPRSSPGASLLFDERGYLTSAERRLLGDADGDDGDGDAEAAAAAAAAAAAEAAAHPSLVIARDVEKPGGALLLATPHPALR